MQTQSTIMKGSSHNNALVPVFWAFDPIHYVTMGFEAKLVVLKNKQHI